VIECEERQRLSRLQKEAFLDWYAKRNELELVQMRRQKSKIGDAKRAESAAHKRVSRIMNAHTSHCLKHGCNID